MSHRIFLAAVAAALVAVAAPAMAQETASPWIGLYVGGNVGGNWGGTQTRTTVAPGGGAVVIPPADVSAINLPYPSTHNSAGIVGGLEGGYGYRAGDVMVGLETDIQSFNVAESNAATFPSSVRSNPTINYALAHLVNTHWLWTLRPRVGYMTGRWMIYGTGGLALSDVQLQASYADNRVPPNLVSLSTSSTRAGWIAGGGLAYAITPQWSIKAEYLYTDLGTIHAANTPPSGFVTLQGRSTVRSNILRLGVDFRF